MSKFVKVEDIIGKAEIQDLLGLTDSQADNFIYRDPKFPQPFLKLRGTRLWEKPVIELWASQRQRALFEVKPVEPPTPEPKKAKVPPVKPVPMTEDERARLVAKIFS